jgi:hypothetical protein
MRTGHTLNAIYKITNVPVLENTTLLAISISTAGGLRLLPEKPALRTAGQALSKARRLGLKMSGPARPGPFRTLEVPTIVKM